MAELAKEAFAEGLAAYLPGGEDIDHQTRLQYIDRIAKMECWNASDRMQLRNHIRQLRNDTLKHKAEMAKSKGGGSGSSWALPAESLNELR